MQLYCDYWNLCLFFQITDTINIYLKRATVDMMQPTICKVTMN